MATVSTSEVTLTTDRGDEKKNSVVYVGSTATGARFSVYVPNDVLAVLKNPPKLSFVLRATK